MVGFRPRIWRVRVLEVVGRGQDIKIGQMSWKQQRRFVDEIMTRTRTEKGWFVTYGNRVLHRSK